MGILDFGKTLIKLKKCDKADLKSEQSLRYQKATCVSVQACEEGNPEKNLDFCQKVSKDIIFLGVDIRAVSTVLC